MAESRRRNKDAVDGGLDETSGLVEASGEASDATPKGKADKVATTDKVGKKNSEKRGNPFSRLARFIREVIGELRKVIWPTRKELLTYTTVVVVFVAVMLTILAVLDFGFAKAVLWVFGN